MSASCSLCGGACAEADLGPLLNPRLAWLWEQLGYAADRRGDAALVEGSLSLRAPGSAEDRAAAAGLVGGRTLKQGQTRRLDLGRLTLKLRARGPQLTPGAVAAHALGRPLAVRAAAGAQRRRREDELRAVFQDTAKSVPRDTLSEPEPIWAALRRSGWLARLATAEDPERFLRSAVAVLAALPPAEARSDRRSLAAQATGNPHALDHGAPLAGLVLAMLVGAGRIKGRQRPREAWASVGVDCDDVVGGLIALGILPVGWSAPSGATVTLPPRVLNTCEWPRPAAPEAWIFVTENPSVASAAAESAARGEGIRLLCTSGTPSAGEIAAIGRLAHNGWRIAVRADFDPAGLGHVAALLKGVPHASPWRMGADDYVGSVTSAMAEEETLERIPDTPWDPRLAVTMRAKGLAAYEEALLPLLLEDLRRGTPR